MFPIYIADFEFQKTENEKRTVTLVLDAHDNSVSHTFTLSLLADPFCRAYLESLLPLHPKSLAGKLVPFLPPPPPFSSSYFYSTDDRSGQLGKNYYVNPHAFLPVAHFLLPMTLSEPPQTSPSSSSSSDSDNEFRSPPGADKLIESYQYFMSPAPTSLTSVPPSPMVDVESEEGGVDWGDVRIRGWGEREENADWLKRAIGIENHLGFIQVSPLSDRAGCVGRC